MPVPPKSRVTSRDGSRAPENEDDDLRESHSRFRDEDIEGRSNEQSRERKSSAEATQDDIDHLIDDLPCSPPDASESVAKSEDVKKEEGPGETQDSGSDNRVKFAIKPKLNHSSTGARSTEDIFRAKGPTQPAAKSTNAVEARTKHEPAADDPAKARDPATVLKTGESRPPRPEPPFEPEVVAIKIQKEKIKKPKKKIAVEYAGAKYSYYWKQGGESVVGSGTYGQVLKATDIYTGQVVALKRIKVEKEKGGVSPVFFHCVKLATNHA